MPGVSKKTPLPHWQKVMDKAGWLTVADMAKALHLPDSTVRMTVHGDRNPSNELILRIAQAAKLNPEDIALDVFRYTVNNSATTGSIAS